MENKIISTTITAVFYVALAVALFVVGQRVLPIATNTVIEMLVTAAKAGEPK